MKIGRNDPCSCGSGKKYKNCCGTGHTLPGNGDRRWVEEHVAKGGDMLLYGSLAGGLEEVPAELFWQECRRIAETYLGGGRERTRQVHALVDATIDALIERDQRFGYPPPFCRKGCCNCCREAVYCTDEEAADILDYCRENGLEIDYAKAARQLDYLECDAGLDHTGVTRWNDQEPEDQTCVFLDRADQSCRIWPVRPLVCRVHLAEGTDRYCAPHNGVENPHARAIDYPETSYILSVVFTIHRDSIRKTMGRLLLGAAPASPPQEK
nr:SEC-C metal-binding domain-containing protein [Geobacter sp. FeAm09]